MEIPSTTSIWLSQQAGPLVLIVALLALVMILLYVSARSRRARMNTVRAGLNEDTFVDSLASYGFDPLITRSAYRYLQDKQNVSFPIEASDLLVEDLGLDLDDIDESILDILVITHRLHQPGLKHNLIITVEDLVRFIQASPRISELAA